MWIARTVHPRVCGELPRTPAIAEIWAGSSPRVRGTRARPTPPRSTFRFIPACAGNSLTSRGLLRPETVHPRVCGELRHRWAFRQQHGGSSPRVRGTRACSSLLWPFGRFIPACAGNSRSRTPRRRCRPVHPRVCGELAWAVERGARAERFIPACAGNSPARGSRRSATPVHPRVCGELGRIGVIPMRLGGSSPRVRGTLAARAPRRPVQRFIPACAGNSSG